MTYLTPFFFKKFEYYTPDSDIHDNIPEGSLLIVNPEIKREDVKSDYTDRHGLAMIKYDGLTDEQKTQAILKDDQIVIDIYGGLFDQIFENIEKLKLPKKRANVTNKNSSYIDKGLFKMLKDRETRGIFKYQFPPWLKLGNLKQGTD